MRSTAFLLFGLIMAACAERAPGSDDEGDGGGMTADAVSSDGTMGCPKPVDCGDGATAVCAVPEPIPIRCWPPITDHYRWTECANGYVIVTRVGENSGIVRYYRNGTLVAVFGGHLTVTCWQGPSDFIRPECTEIRSVDLCAKDASAESANP